MKIIPFRKIFALIILILIFSSQVPAQAAKTRFEISERSWKWADKQLKKMTLEEKIGQTLSYGINARYLNQNSAEFQEIKRQVAENKIGGIILFAGPVYESVHVVNRMQALAKYPLLIAADFETGVGMRFEETANFPWNMAVGATGDPELARREGFITAREARSLGVYHVYAPVADINNNADNPVINVRSYGEDPQEVARYAVAFAEGLQAGGVLATAKHFPGHGDTATDSHRGLPIINLPRSRLDQVEFFPFKKLIDAGIGSVMIAHIAIPQIDATEIKPLKQPGVQPDVEEGAEIITEATSIPATLSEIVHRQILRKEMNFQGLIVTDALSMSGLTLYVSNTEGPARAFIAGADMLLKPVDIDQAIRGMKDAIASGKITEARLDESVRKILAIKHELGLVKDRFAPIDNIDTVVSGMETLQLADEIAKKAVTLVRDDQKLLPLKNISEKRVFVLGISNGEDRFNIMNTFTRTLRQSGAKLDVVILDNRVTPEEARTALEKANKADIVITALFGRVRSGAKNSVGLPEPGAQLLRRLLTTDKPLVAVSFGNPYFLNSFPNIKTYVAAYGDMTSLQRAAGNAVLGKEPFTGRLPITLPGLAPRGTGIQLRNE